MILKQLRLSFAITALMTFAAAADADLVHQWKFNGFATDSVGSAHGTLGGGASITGDRLSLDGIDGQVVTQPLDTTLTEKTLVSWVSLNDLDQPGGGSALSVQVSAGGGAGGFDGIVYAERQPRQWMNGSNGFVRSVPDNLGAQETVTDPGEVMMAITYAADNSITLYRNGVEYAGAANASQGTLNTYVGGTANAIFGRRHDGAGNPLNGFVNESRVYNEVLSPSAINDIFFNGPDVSPSDPPPPPPGPELLHQWTFNGDGRDQAGEAHGGFEGGAQLAGAGGAGRLSVDGATGSRFITSALGQNIGAKTLVSWVSLNDLNHVAGSALTIENDPNGSVFDGIVYAERVPGQWMAGSNGFVRSVPDNGGAAETVGEPGEVMIAIAYDNDNSITIYRDGVEYASAANTSQGSLQSFGAGAVAQIGPRHGATTQVINGFVNEARIYGGALSATEIQDLFLLEGPSTTENPPFVPPGPELRHQWTFNNGDLSDQVGNADGRVEGGAQLAGGGNFGRLSVDGQAGSRFITDPIGDGIGEKTLVAWVSLNDVTNSSKGSALTIETNDSLGNLFDGIVYGEVAAQKWMAGSNNFVRTASPQDFGTEETVGEPGEVMVSIVYADDNSITLYRDGELYGSYTKGAVQPYDENALVQIGPRHGPHPDVFDGFINEARIYSGALDAEAIRSIFEAGPVIPEPGTLGLTLVGLLGILGLARRNRRIRST